MRSIFILLTALLAANVAAQEFVEADAVELVSIDPDTNNGRLGRNVALANGGRTLLAAAPFKLDPLVSGSQNGSVYSFTVSPGGVLQFDQALEPGPRNRFGEVLAAEGDWAAIGESGDKVRLYRLSGTQWTLTQLLRINPDVPATPGITVRGLSSAATMSGNLLAVGNASANVVVGDVTENNAGAVVLFRRGGDNVWRHEATLIAPQPSSSSAFGTALALSGDTLLVGAPTDRVDGVSVGGAYVFQRIGGSWSHARTLRNPDLSQTAQYGWSVALDGNLAIVGCATCLTLPNPGDPSNTGSFFAYERNLGGSGNWGLRGEFASDEPRFIDNFSIALKLRGETLLVGASGSKRASFFVREADGAWRQAALFRSAESELPRTTNFGISVDFFGGRAIVGADAYPDTSTSERWGEVTSWFGATVEACRGNFDAIFCDGYESFD